jgi:hypothetical protein
MKQFTTISRITMLMALALLLVVSIALAQASDNYDLSWHVVSGGGGPMSSTNYAINGTIGQAAIGPAVSTNYDLGAGYWYGVVIQIGPVEFKIYLPLILKNY